MKPRSVTARSVLWKEMWGVPVVISYGKLAAPVPIKARMMLLVLLLLGGHDCCTPTSSAYSDARHHCQIPLHDAMTYHRL
jgi:hypothetical protein